MATEHPGPCPGREFISLLGGAAAAWPLAARAQQRERIRRIGVLTPFAANDTEGHGRLTAFAQGLQQLGWTVGQNLRIDYRWGDAKVRALLHAIDREVGFTKQRKQINLEDASIKTACLELFDEISIWVRKLGKKFAQHGAGRSPEGVISTAGRGAYFRLSSSSSVSPTFGQRLRRSCDRRYF